MQIRPETPADFSTIRQINEAAFPTPAEAALVEALRVANQITLSLVTEIENHIVGHVLFCPIQIEGENQTHAALALAPLAVLPEFQKRGLGSALVREGLKLLGENGHELVIVLGHPHFYARFGFSPASRWKIRAPFEVPAEAFMALELRPGAAENKMGVVKYPAAFEVV